jgi:cytochrome P450/NADPH-cytochrome P450 reductase
MRGFIQDRVADGTKENMLFFGCRDDDDYLYREELEGWVDRGFLTLFVAFSRKEGCAKTYVQHLVERESARVLALLERGAHVYVCGDASKMAPDVQATFSRICQQGGLGTEHVQTMIDGGKYCQDVWASQSL